jgi:hypothetical protein
MIFFLFYIYPPLNFSDHAPYFPREGRFDVNCHELGIQFPCRRNDSNPSGSYQVAPVSDARFLLCLQFHFG